MITEHTEIELSQIYKVDITRDKPIHFTIFYVFVLLVSCSD